MIVVVICVLTIVCIITLINNAMNHKMNRYIHIAIRRWIRVHSEFIDKSLYVRLERKLDERSSKHKRVMLGSSTIARMPSNIAGETYVNFGVEALCSHHLVQHLSLLNELRADVVILYVGVNDLTLNIPPQSIADNINAIVEALGRARVVYIPIIESVYQTVLGEKRCEYLQRVNTAVSGSLIEHTNVTFVHPPFEGPDFSYDGLHLSKSGYVKLVNAVSQVL